MPKNYKLTPEIEKFILEQKKGNPKLSCRSMEELITKQFNIYLSKSLINNVMKKGNLSSPVGRRREREEIAPPKVEIPLVKEAEIVPKETFIPPEKETPVQEPILPAKPSFEPGLIKPVKQEADLMENGGYFLLKAADLKLGFTASLSQALSGYFPGLPSESHQKIIETLVYKPYFKDKKSLCLLVGAEVAEETLNQYTEKLILVPILELKACVEKVGISRKLIGINDLWTESLLRLNSYIVHFFPPEYQFLDLPAMRNRFYCLPARIEKKSSLLIIQLFCPRDFYWLNDIIWQEGFSFAVNRLNDAGILTQEKEQIWISPQVKFP